MTDGWRERSSFSPAEFIAEFEDDPLAGIIVTDVGGMIGEGDASLGAITAWRRGTRHPVIARGTVYGIDDVARLKYVSQRRGHADRAGAADARRGSGRGDGGGRRPGRACRAASSNLPPMRPAPRAADLPPDPKPG